MICLTSGIKPISSIRSASSSTNTSTRSKNNFPRLTQSKIRPGVPIKISKGRLLIVLSCFSKSTPPVMQSDDNELNLINSRQSA